MTAAIDKQVLTSEETSDVANGFLHGLNQLAVVTPDSAHALLSEIIANVFLESRIQNTPYEEMVEAVARAMRTDTAWVERYIIKSGVAHAFKKLAREGAV